jgi:hypothetical protein
MRAVFVTVVMATACGGHPPPPAQGVIKSDLGSWHYRRFQGPMTDVEVWVDGNKAEMYSASYITDDAEKRGRIDDNDLVNVVVTRYEKPDGVVRATVKLVRRLAQENHYQVDEDKISGARALTIHSPDETWVMWSSTKYVVKVGGRGRKDVPKNVVASYADRYPSDLPGGALEGPLPAGPDGAPKKSEPKPEYDPKNPTPDFDKYDPKKVKVIPEKKVDTSNDDDDAAKKDDAAAKKDDSAAKKDDAAAKKDDPAPKKKKKKKDKKKTDDE